MAVYTADEDGVSVRIGDADKPESLPQPTLSGRGLAEEIVEDIEHQGCAGRVPEIGSPVTV